MGTCQCQAARKPDTETSMGTCQYGDVSVRRRVSTGTCQNGDVSEWGRVKMGTCRNGVVSEWGRVGTGTCQYGDPDTLKPAIDGAILGQVRACTGIKRGQDTLKPARVRIEITSSWILVPCVPTCSL